jgi:serine/threonine protein phosphatase 1
MEQSPKKETRLYAIGDIHGRLDLLERMIEAIRRDAREHGGDSLTITLGDYVDRGPKSRDVIDRLIANPFPGRYVALKGNHEALMLSFLDDPRGGAHWHRLGGLETLRSFDIRERDMAKAAAQLRAALNPAQMTFLNSLQLSLSVGGYFFCHAGVRPGVALDAQSEEDLLWIRGEFLDSEVDFGKIVVHGHTPVVEPQVKANRINVDTGAFTTGKLTCLVLEDGRHRFITA